MKVTEMSQSHEELLVVIWQPDGSLAIGSDPARVLTKKQRTAIPAPGTLSSEETAAAQQALEERRAEALQYQRTTLHRRRNVFLALIACDFCFFFGVLVYQAAAAQSLMNGLTPETEGADSFFATSGTSNSGASSSSEGDSSTSSSRRLIPLAWWISPSSLRLEDLVLSIVIDIMAAAGAVQNRTAVLSLYCVVQVLSTAALSTMLGLSLSLFTAFRLVSLLLAFYLRSAIFTWIALQQAAELPLEPDTAARLQQLLLRSGRTSLFNMLFRTPRLDSSRQEQQPAEVAAERGDTSSATEQQGLVQHLILPAAGATASSAAATPAPAVAPMHEVSSAGAAGPASIARGSLEGQGSAEVELAAGASLHHAQQQQQQQQQHCS
ncbi:hypothetical protein COO60DRAFT_92710 [Scenedesmus sp. NREL 46B-D3]|nr:hypothetical protein COO60DRAFT_92710 [Scenedesmus sp. NREL 46B-D3]